MARDTRATLRIPVGVTGSPLRTIAAVSVFEPSTNDQVVEMYDQLCDLFDQAAGDNFLAAMESVAQQRGLVDPNGRRVRARKQLQRS